MSSSRPRTVLICGSLLLSVLALGACGQQDPPDDPVVSVSAADLAEDARKQLLRPTEVSAADAAEDARKGALQKARLSAADVAEDDRKARARQS